MEDKAYLTLAINFKLNLSIPTKEWEKLEKIRRLTGRSVGDLLLESLWKLTKGRAKRA